jgi:hypothetical protein
VSGGCKTARGQPPLQQRMTLAQDSDKAVAQQRLHADFRSDIAERADIEINSPFA